MDTAIPEAPSYSEQNDKTAVEMKPTSFRGFENKNAASEKAKEAEEQQAGLSWKDFTQNTTLHGLKYAFEGHTISLRRLLWLVFVLVALLAIIVLVSIRVMEYFDYKTSVDVQFKYTDSLDFPSVTICNHNSFRLTKAAEWDLYQSLDAVFRRDNLTELHDSFDSVNSTDFLPSAAHTIDDMIVECTWKGQACNISEDFKLVVTDMGVCYTFASHDTNNRKINEAGSRHGLSLAMNVEQYEYMRGPQSDAGIMVLLHGEHEFPLVREQGITVAPGMHTIIAMRRTESQSLPQPYGECNEDDTYCKNNCMVDCQTKIVRRECGCVDFHMMDYENTSEVCSLPKLYNCIPNAIEKMHKLSNGTCKCPKSCMRVTFDPMLSFAQLSHFNLDEMMSQTGDKNNGAAEKFLRAKESSQRVVQSSLHKNQELFKELLDGRDKLASVIGSTQAFWNADMLNETIFFDKSAFTKDADIFQSERTEIWFDYGVLKKDLRRTSTMGTSIEEFTDSAEPKSLHNYLIDCEADLKDYENMTAGQCKDYVTSKLTSAQTLLPSLNSSFLDLSNMKQKTDALNTKTYENTTSSPDRVPEYVQCNQLLDEIDSIFVPSFQLAMDGVDQFLNATDYNSLLSAAQTIESQLSTLGNFTTLYDEANKVCWWMLVTSGTKYPTVDMYKFTLVQTKGNTVKVSMESMIQTHYQPMLQMLEDISAHFHVLNVTQQSVNSYIDREMTKLQLSNVFLNKTIQTYLNLLVTDAANLPPLINRFKASLTEKTDDVIDIYSSLFDMHVPLLTPDTIEQLSITKQARDIDLMQSLPLYNATHFNSMIEDLITVYTDALSGQLTGLTSGISDMDFALQDLIEDVELYKQSCQIDKQFYMDNFLHVDIFYKEMAYHRIDQLAAFHLPSLFGEMGGFLGLLMGASILSFCEIIDYVLHTLIIRSKMVKKKK